MKFQKRIKLEHGLEQIDIVAMINVMFLLLVFFLLSNYLTVQSGANVKLPKTVTSDVVNEDNFIVTITSENILYVNRKIVTLKELSRELEKIAHQNKPLIIKADRRVSMGRVVDVWDLCRKYGVERINIATN